MDAWAVKLGWRDLSNGSAGGEGGGGGQRLRRADRMPGRRMSLAGAMWFHLHSRPGRFKGTERWSQTDGKGETALGL